MKRMEPSLNFSVKPWLFQVEPYSDESFGHFLGRFRRANYLSSAHLSALLKERAYLVSYWECPSRQRRPGKAHLEQLSQLTGVDILRFQGMWSPPGIRLYWPTRICPDCYAEAPWHKLTWQLTEQSDCKIHQRSLLTQCPRCYQAFQLPSHWATGECEHCRLPFVQMSLTLGCCQ